MKKLKDENSNAPYTGKAFCYIAIAALIISAVFIGLMFTVLGVYSLIGSVLSELCALAFVNAQKRRNDFPKLAIVKICAYALLAISVAVFIGGIIWASVSGK